MPQMSIMPTIEPPVAAPPAVAALPAQTARITAQGKFFYRGDEPFLVRGTTYGPFCPEDDGSEYHTPREVDRDFAMMAEHGINTVRVYTVPPRWLLDLAQRHQLYVLVGLPWEQHIAFLDSAQSRQQIVQKVRQGVRACANHPAVLAFALGNEIPATIVRWYGHNRVERFLLHLYTVVRQEAPSTMVTYVNYPTTEYLYLPFLDFLSLNVYLETREKLSHYLSRLHNIAGDKPLLLAEVGMDSLKWGEPQQAAILGWQIRVAFRSGCAGVFIFSWTDEWYRGGHEISGWAFGLTTRNRRPRPALTVVADTFGKLPFGPAVKWPTISVVICTYNGSKTIRFCLDGVRKLRYPDFEVIVVDDGSRDAIADIVREYPVQLIQTPNQGLSHARNVGLTAARGDIIAYLDDDATPQPYWLHFIAETFRRGKYVGVGGPNIAPPGEGIAADAVAHSPGGPLHVLLTDTEAEHIPGCNMAFLTHHLRAIGGFDETFRIAGDDVDACWRLQARGGKLGFSPGAAVWHKRRNSIRAYWRQQLNYGKAEAMLERKWPEKYNGMGHIAWHGRLYGRGIWQFLNWGRRKIFHGSGGSALFQSVYHGNPGVLMSVAMMPEWYLAVLSLSLMFMAGFYWHPIFLGLMLLAAVAATVAQAAIGACYSPFNEVPRTRMELIKLRLLTMWCYLIQPVARLSGRLSRGLNPWRMRFPRDLDVPIPREFGIWSQRWRSNDDRLNDLETYLKNAGLCVQRGGDFDRWDISIRSGVFGSIRMRMAIEEHGQGQQLVRLRTWPTFPKIYLGLVCVLAVLGGFDLVVKGWPGAVPMLILAGIMALRASMDAGAALAEIVAYVGRRRDDECEIRNNR